MLTLDTFPLNLVTRQPFMHTRLVKPRRDTTSWVSHTRTIVPPPADSMFPLRLVRNQCHQCHEINDQGIYSSSPHVERER